MSRVNGGATQLTREEIQKKSVAADSSSKIYELGVPLACGSRHSRRSQKPAVSYFYGSLYVVGFYLLAFRCIVCLY